MKKKSLKVIVFLIFIFSLFVNTTYAANTDSLTNSSGNTGGVRNQTIDQVIGGAKNFINNADTNEAISGDGAQSTIDLIYNIFLAIGLVVAVICGVILGIQFMMSSSEGQASVKEKLIPYAVGCVIIFGAFGIWKLIMILLQGF